MSEAKVAPVTAPEVTEPVAPVAEETMATLLPEERGPVVSIKVLLEAGSHFGHQTRRWNPKMKPYIYSARSGVYIIDLDKTVKKVEEAYSALKDIVERGGKVLFVGTRNQYREIIEEEALRSGSFYINSRWLGGTLTNFRTIQSRIRYLRDLEREEEDGALDLLPKKEAAALRKEKEKLSKNLEGIKEMRKTPQAIFVCDPKIEQNAVREARILGIPVFGIVDTNNDPDEVDYMIPANDDAIRSVKLIVGLMADAIVEAKGGMPIYAYASGSDDDGSEQSMAALGDIEVEDKDHPRRQPRPQQPRRQNQPRREKTDGAPIKKAPVKPVVEEDEDEIEDEE